MSDTVSTELKEYLDSKFQDLTVVNLKLESKLDRLQEDVDRIEVRQAKLEQDVVEIKVGQAKLEGSFKGEIAALSEKVDGLGKRLDNAEFINRGVLIGILVAILGSLAKMAGFVGKP